MIREYFLTKHIDIGREPDASDMRPVYLGKSRSSAQRRTGRNYVSAVYGIDFSGDMTVGVGTLSETKRLIKQLSAQV